MVAGEYVFLYGLHSSSKLSILFFYISQYFIFSVPQFNVALYCSIGRSVELLSMFLEDLRWWSKSLFDVSKVSKKKITDIGTICLCSGATKSTYLRSCILVDFERSMIYQSLRTLINITLLQAPMITAVANDHYQNGNRIINCMMFRTKSFTYAPPHMRSKFEGSKKERTYFTCWTDSPIC